MKAITLLVLQDLFRNRFMALYAALLALLSWTALGLEDNPDKGLLTLMSLILMIVPLVAILFSTTYLYRSAEFVELLASQPIPRSAIWHSINGGLAISLCLAFTVGVSIPVFLYSSWQLALTMSTMGILLTLVFIGIAALSSVRNSDKARGIGWALVIWLYFALLFDVLVLFLLFQFSQYPIEHFMVVLVASSPVDLARIHLLLQMDAAAMMGYTGAIFRDFFGNGTGTALSLVLMLLWAVVPYLFSLYYFKRKNL